MFIFPAVFLNHFHSHHDCFWRDLSDIMMSVKTEVEFDTVKFVKVGFFRFFKFYFVSDSHPARCIHISIFETQQKYQQKCDPCMYKIYSNTVKLEIFRFLLTDRLWYQHSRWMSELVRIAILRQKVKSFQTIDMLLRKFMKLEIFQDRINNIVKLNIASTPVSHVRHQIKYTAHQEREIQLS